MTIHLAKLCVGIDSLEHLESYRAAHYETPDTPTRHVTRMWPKREAELLDGGSLYWVIKGMMVARQKVLRLEEVIGHDGIRRCAIIMDPELIRVHPTPRRAFQGWRYLTPEDAPVDMKQQNRDETALPPELAAALGEIGVL